MKLCSIKVIANGGCCNFTMSTEHEPRVPEQSFPRILGLSSNLSQQPNSFPTTLLAQLPANTPRIAALGIASVVVERSCTLILDFTLNTSITRPPTITTIGKCNTFWIRHSSRAEAASL
jgi:hypothetical protein